MSLSEIGAWIAVRERQEKARYVEEDARFRSRKQLAELQTKQTALGVGYAFNGGEAFEQWLREPLFPESEDEVAEERGVEPDLAAMGPYLTPRPVTPPTE